MFEFAVKMTDNVSSAANAASASVKRLRMANAELMIAQMSATATAEELSAAYIEQAAAASEAAAATSETGLASAIESVINPATVATAVVAAMTAAVVGLGAALVMGAKEALSASEAHRRLTEQLGSGTLAMIRKLETEVPQSEEQLSEWARTLRAAGVTDLTKLHDQMLAVASAEAIVSGGGEKVKTLLAKMAEFGDTKVKAFSLKSLVGTGLTQEEFLKALGMTPAAMALAVKRGKLTGNMVAEAITKGLQEKGKGPLESAMLELSATFTKFKDNVSKIFEDVNVKPFLEEISKTAKMFDQSTASGKSFKLLVTGAFNAIFQAASKVFPYVRMFLLQLTINALKVYIALKPMAAEWAKFVKSKPNMQQLSWAKGFADALTGVFFVVIKVAKALQVLMATIATVTGWMQAGSKASGSLIQGLVSGISGGSGSVGAAMKALATSSLKSFTSALGIASPSKVMRAHGEKNIAGALATGLDAGRPQVGKAMAQLTSGGSPQAPKGGGGNTFKPPPIIIKTDGTPQANAMAASLKTQLDDYFEQMALSQGAI